MPEERFGEYQSYQTSQIQIVDNDILKHTGFSYTTSLIC